MIEKIEKDGVLYAIIIRHDYEPQATEFFTPKENSMQFGIIKHEKGYVDKPHFHRKRERVIWNTQETLQIVRGEVAIDFYTNEGEKVASTLLETGDAILMAEGAHAIRVIQDFWGVTVKQGPYISIEEDKAFLEPK